ncbi:MAG: hypothetical protein JXD18_13340 [Anaerolineae bacterium]|nr:hypothetical protein [Anaerolineae bacterium]
MAECIVCKADITEGVCGRCHTDSASWVEWRKNAPEEQEGWTGFKAFLEPLLYLPLQIPLLVLITDFLVGPVVWSTIRPAVHLLAILAVVLGCPLIAAAAYTDRQRLRENELLSQVQNVFRGGNLSIRAKIWMMVILCLLFTSFITMLLTQNDQGWQFTQHVLLDVSQTEERLVGVASAAGCKGAKHIKGEVVPDTFFVRVQLFMPLTLMMLCVSLVISSAYASSMLLVKAYIDRMDQAIPPPLFLQTEKLADVVRREAEHVLGRPGPSPSNPGHEAEQDSPAENGNGLTRHVMVCVRGENGLERPALPPDVSGMIPDDINVTSQVQFVLQASTWAWDEFWRTPNGGVALKVARQEKYQPAEAGPNANHSTPCRACYVVKADPWGRIVAVERETLEPPKRPKTSLS